MHYVGSNPTSRTNGSILDKGIEPCYYLGMPYADKEKQKEAQRRHYEANREISIARAAERKRVAYAKIAEIKEASPCVDCGKKYPYYVMQFDHTGTDKSMDVSKLVRCAGWVRVEAEIAKCDLVCANCHAVRTWSRSKV